MKTDIQNKPGNNTNEYEVETIKNKKVINGVPYYLLKWKGYGEKENTWEPVSNLNCPELISEYEKLKGNTNKRWRHHSIRIEKPVNSNNSNKDQLDNLSSTTKKNIKKKSKNTNREIVELNENEEINENNIFKEDSETSHDTNFEISTIKKKTRQSSRILNKEKDKNKENNIKKEKEIKNDNEIKKSPKISVIDINDYEKLYSTNSIIPKSNNFQIEIDDDSDSNFFPGSHKKRRRIIDNGNSKNTRYKKEKKNSKETKGVKIKEEKIKKEINDDEVIEVKDYPTTSPYHDELYKKIYYKKLFKKNNELTDDFNTIRKVEKNVRDWINIIIDGQFDKITVYNDVDLDGPPSDFKYISTCEYGEDVPKPEDISDFIIGCDCIGGCENEILCSCSVRDNYDVPISFSYNKKGEVLITRTNIIHECNSKCLCGPDCPNRVIQKNSIPYLEIFKTKGKGWGVRTKELIRKSTFVAEYTGEIIKTDRVSERIKNDVERTHYIFDVDILGEPEYSIDAYKMGNITHFINHSCDPNLEVYCAQCDYYEMNIFRIAFFAKRDIQIDEELTFDYIGIEKPGGLLKCGDHYTINTLSTISSTSSIPMSPNTPEEPVCISHTIKKEKPAKHQKIVININSEDESIDDQDSENSRQLLKYRYNTRSQSKIQTRSQSQTKKKNNSNTSNTKAKSKADLEEEKNLFVVCKCGSANCRGYVYKY